MTVSNTPIHQNMSDLVNQANALLAQIMHPVRITAMHLMAEGRILDCRVEYDDGEVDYVFISTAIIGPHIIAAAVSTIYRVGRVASIRDQLCYDPSADRRVSDYKFDPWVADPDVAIEIEEDDRITHQSATDKPRRPI